MSKFIQRVRDYLARPSVRVWAVLYRKPVAATLAAAVVALARVVGLDLPSGYPEVVAAAVVGYLVPERPKAVTVKHLVHHYRDAPKVLPGESKHFGRPVPPDFGRPDVPARDVPVLGDDDTRGLA